MQAQTMSAMISYKHQLRMLQTATDRKHKEIEQLTQQIAAMTNVLDKTIACRRLSKLRDVAKRWNRCIATIGHKKQRHVVCYETRGCRMYGTR